MATNTTHIDASVEEVFEVLADAQSYEHWVVGSSEIRRVEGDWPAVDATFHHTQGVPKVGLKDTTTVLKSRSPTYLQMCVRTRPVLIAEVTLELSRREGGTSVVMTEVVVGGWLDKVAPAVDVGIRVRNTESLRRLKRLAERPSSR